MSSDRGCRSPSAGDSDPLELPDYVADSLRAWCEFDRRRRDARSELRVTEREDLYGKADDYDPLSDWLDEPLPMEGL